MTDAKRESLRSGFSLWRLLTLMHSESGPGPYGYQLLAIGLSNYRIGRELGIEAPTFREQSFLNFLAAACLVMGHEWLYVERAAMGELLGCHGSTAARMLNALVGKGLVEQEATYDKNARLDALAARGCTNTRGGFDWERGVCYRPSAALRALWERFTARAAACNHDRPRTLEPELYARALARSPKDRARGSNMAVQRGEPTPDPDPDRSIDTEIPSTNTSTGKRTAPAAPEKVHRLLGGASQLRVVSAPLEITSNSSEVRNQERRPNGHSVRCTCLECSAELEAELRKEHGGDS